MNPPEFQNFTLSICDHVALFTINRPEVRNAINAECYGEIERFMSFAETCDEIRAIIITGAGNKSFASGADISELATRRCVTHLHTPARAALLKIENSAKPVIAAVNGYAFGGGFELMLACDLCVCSERAKFALPETGLGIMPASGGTQRLPRMIGVRKTKEIVLTGRILEPDEMVSLGLVNKKVSPEELIPEAMKMAQAIAKKAPAATAMAKRSINQSLYTDVNTGANNESVMMAMLLETDDAKEGLHAFLEKREPIFTGK